MECHPNFSHKQHKKNTVDDKASQWLVEFDPVLASCTHNTSPGYSVQHGNIFKNIKLKQIESFNNLPSNEKKRQNDECQGVVHNIIALF
jgi:hypothetical protein